MFVHLISGTWPITQDVMRFYNKNISNGDHRFILLNPWHKSQTIEKFEDFEFLEVVDLSRLDLRKLSDSRTLLSKLNDSDLIILHDLSVYSLRMMILTFLFYRKFFSRIVWLTWGHDLYTVTKKTKTKKTIKAILYLTLSKYFAKKINAIVTCFPTDVDLCKDFFRRKNIFYLPYRGLPKVCSDKINQNDGLNFSFPNKIAVLCSHRVAPSTCTYDIIEPLSKFKNESLNLVLPCNMSNEYYQKVKNKMLDVFDKKVFVLEDFLQINEYYRLLESVDIAIFPTNLPQQALGTIRYLFKHKKKVFLSEKSLMYDFFRNIGCEIYKFEDIENMSFKEFSTPVQDNSVNEKFCNLIENDVFIADTIKNILELLKNNEVVTEFNFFNNL